MVVPMILMNKDLQYAGCVAMRNALTPAKKKKKRLVSLSGACLCARVSLLSQPAVTSGLPLIPL